MLFNNKQLTWNDTVKHAHRSGCKEFGYFLSKVEKKFKMLCDGNIKIVPHNGAIINFNILKQKLINIWQKVTILKNMVEVKIESRPYRDNDLSMIMESVYSDAIIRIASFYETKVNSDENKGSNKLSIYFFIKAIKNSGDDQNYRFVVEQIVRSIEKYKLIKEIKIMRDLQLAHYYINDNKLKEMKNISELENLVEFSCRMLDFIRILINIPKEKLMYQGILFKRNENLTKKLKDALKTFEEIS